MELELATGGAPMPRLRPVKRLSDGELAELRAQLIDLLDHGWIQHSTARHAAAAVFARKPDRPGRGVAHLLRLQRPQRFHAPGSRPLQHIYALLDVTRGSRFFTKLDLAGSFHQLRVRAADRWKTSFQSQLGPGVERGALRSTGRLFANACHEPGANRRFRIPRWSDNDADDRWGRGRLGDGTPLGVSTPRPTLAPIHGGVLGASGPLGQCALVYMDDCLVHSPTLEQHLLDVEEVLEIFRRRQLYAKSSKCEIGRQVSA